MKSLSLFVLLSLMLVSSCKKQGVSTQDKDSKLLSGTLTIKDVSNTVEIDGKKITFEVKSDKVKAGLRGPGTWDGPFYSKGTQRMVYSNQKVVLMNSIFAAGVYFCDVYAFTNTIQLPANAMVGKITLPSPSGYSNYTTQELGVNWTMTSGTTGLVLNFTFYTLVVRYNSAGQSMGGKVIPINGNLVSIPYYYMTE